MTPDLLVRLGGLLAFLTLCHFVFDWLCQPHTMAYQKSKSLAWLGLHSLCYAISFFPILRWTVGFSFHVSAEWTFYLLATHAFFDSYIPVKAWERWVRRPPAEIAGDRPVASMQTVTLQVVRIVADQLFHVLSLIPIAVCAARL